MCARRIRKADIGESSFNKYPIHWVFLSLPPNFFFRSIISPSGMNEWEEALGWERRKKKQKSHSASASPSIRCLFKNTQSRREWSNTPRMCARGNEFFFVFQLFFHYFFSSPAFCSTITPKKWKNKTQFLMRLGPCVSSVCCLGLVGSPSSIVRWVDDDSQAQQSTTATRESWRPPSTLARCCCCSIISTMRTISSSSRAPSAWRFCFGFFFQGGFQFVKMDYITGYLLACGEGSERSIFIIFCSLASSFALEIWSHATLSAEMCVPCMTLEDYSISFRSDPVPKKKIEAHEVSAETKRKSHNFFFDRIPILTGPTAHKFNIYPPCERVSFSFHFFPAPFPHLI